MSTKPQREWNAFFTSALDGDRKDPRSGPNVLAKRKILPVLRTESH